MMRRSPVSSLVPEKNEIHSMLDDRFTLKGSGTWLGQLKVGQKITLGYMCVLGTAMLGTALGFVIGDHYQHEAIHEEEDAIEELYEANQLKSAVFRVRTQQHKLILYMKQPEIWQQKYTQLVASVKDVRQEWVDFKMTFRNPARRLKDTPREKAAYAQLMNTKSDFDNYLNQSERLFAASNPQKLSAAEIERMQSKLFNFMHNPQVFTLDEFLDNIANLVNVTAAEYDQAKADLRKAERLRLQIIAISLLASAAIAIGLGIYMHRAIARPIQTVTHIAQQVTEDGNFDLQAPVTTQDEIGILAVSLNRLIQEVQQLLQFQKDSNEQLEVYNEILEKKIQERTRELKEKNRSLQQTLEVLHQIQTQLIQSEKGSCSETMTQMTQNVNDPVHQIRHYLNTIRTLSQQLLELLALYQRHYPEPERSIQTKITEIHLESIQAELPRLLGAIEDETSHIINYVNFLYHPQ